jgi:hypothetical protein
MILPVGIRGSLEKIRIFISLLSAVLILLYLLTVAGWSIERAPDPYV